MKTISELQEEKNALVERLKSITSYHEDGSQYYIDNELADDIKREINSLDESIQSLGLKIRSMREEDEAREQVLRRRDRDKLVSTAKSYYDEQITTYMNLGFFGRAMAMFAGKKPKRLTDREILEIYGKDALDELISTKVDAILQAKDEQLRVIAGMYDPESDAYRYAVQELESIFEDKIERCREGYESELANAINGSSPRRGMR